MDKLVAINEHVAVFLRDDEKAPELDTYGYLDGLLSIRSAYGFVEFLYKYPNGLLKKLPIYSVDHASEHQCDSAIPPAYSANSLKNAIAKLNKKYKSKVVYYDESFDDRNISTIEKLSQASSASNEEAYSLMKRLWEEDDEATRFDLFNELMDMIPADCSSLYSLDIDEVVHLHMQIQDILGLAIRGRKSIFEKNEGRFSKKQTARIVKTSASEARQNKYVPFLLRCSSYEIVQDGAKNTRIGIFSFPFEALNALLPGVELFDFEKYERLSAQLLDAGMPAYDNENHKLIVKSYEGYTCFNEISGCIAAWLLSEWDSYYCKTPLVTFSTRYGFNERTVEPNIIIRKLKDIVVKGKFDSCTECRRPFVAKRTNRNGTLCRETCTDNCKSIRNKNAQSDVKGVMNNG